MLGEVKHPPISIEHRELLRLARRYHQQGYGIPEFDSQSNLDEVRFEVGRIQQDLEDQYATDTIRETSAIKARILDHRFHMMTRWRTHIERSLQHFGFGVAGGMPMSAVQMQMMRARSSDKWLPSHLSDSQLFEDVYDILLFVHTVERTLSHYLSSRDLTEKIQSFLRDKADDEQVADFLSIVFGRAILNPNSGLLLQTWWNKIKALSHVRCDCLVVTTQNAARVHPPLRIRGMEEWV